jgi:hypothetical protein
MPSAGEIRQQVAKESEVRSRLSVPAFAGGFLYLLAAVVGSATESGLPKVGLLQGLAPALKGEANPPLSPRTGEVKFISHHAWQLVISSVLAAVAVTVLIGVLLLLFDAARFRRPGTWAQARLLVIVGGAGVVLTSVGHQIVTAFETHKFAVGHDFSNHAVEQALTKNTGAEIFAYLGLLTLLAFVAGMVIVLLNALRAGLLPRWLAFLGMFSALLILIPAAGATLQLIPAFWLVMMGMLNAGRWPSGDPPAWPEGVARPWPSRAQMQARRAGVETAGEVKATEVAPAATPVKASSRKRRKRGARS